LSAFVEWIDEKKGVVADDPECRVCLRRSAQARSKHERVPSSSSSSPSVGRRRRLLPGSVTSGWFA
jgi:hypothetical protein